jgi:hypothetical protein
VSAPTVPRAAVRRRLQLFTASASRTFRRCPREYRLRYLDRIVPSGGRARPLRFGTTWHYMLEAWWKAWRYTARTRLDRMLDELDARVATALEEDEADETEVLEDRARLRALGILYHARWNGERIKVLDVEREYRAPLVNPSTGFESQTWERAGKIDAIGQLLVASADLPAESVVIVEHKTTSSDISPGSMYWRALTIDSQLSHYVAAGKALGHDVAGCVYDVVAKPKLERKLATPEDERKYTVAVEAKPAKGKRPAREAVPSRLYANQRETDETLDEYEARLLAHMQADPDRYVRRATIVRLEEDLAAAALDDWQTARLMREAEVEKRWPRNPDACLRYQRPCDYLPLCAREASEDDPMYTRADAHSELSKEEDACPTI